MLRNYAQSRFTPEEERYEQLAEQEATRYLLRDPRLAAVLSALVMGLGQLFNGQYKRALTFFGGELAVFLYLWDFSGGLAVSQTLIGLTAPRVYQAFLWALTIGGLGLWLYNIRDAYRMAEFCQFIYDRAFPALDEEESAIVARHLTINRGGLSFHRGLSTKAVFLGGGVILYSAALLALGAFYLGRRDRVTPVSFVAPAHPRPASDSNDPKARLRAGEAAYEAGELATAQRELEHVLSLDAPARLRYEALVDLAKVASAQGDEPKANDCLMRAVALSRQISTQQVPSPESPLARAGEALAAGDPGKAEKLLEPVASDTQGWLVLGRAAAARGEWEKARHLFAGYAARSGAEPVVHLELARAEARLARRADALRQVRRYLKLEPSSVDGALVLAELLEAERGAAEAYKAIEQALAQHPSDRRLLEEAMQLAEAAGNTDQAMQAARALLKQDPSHLRARTIVEEAAPSLRPGLRQRTKARETPETAGPEAARAPTRDQPAASPAAAPGEVPVERYADALREAELAYSQGDLERALERYERVLAVRPDHPRSLSQKAAILAARKDRAGAIRALETAVKSRPADVASLSELGKLYMEAEDYDSAREAFRKVVAQEPRNLAARYALAELMERKDELDGAEEQYQAILRHYPELTPAYEYLGNLYYRQERFEEALGQFQRMLSSSGADPMVRFKMGLINVRLSREEKALAHFRAVRAQIGRKHELYAQVEKQIARLERHSERSRDVDGGEP